MDLRNKVFWGVFYSLVFGYLMVGLIWENESPVESFKNFPLQFREKDKPAAVQAVETVKKVTEVNKPL